MWAWAITAPGRLERVETDAPDPATLAPGRVLVRYEAGAVCGSDLPSFLGRRNPFVDHYGEPGYPMHEVVGEVEASTAPHLPVGTRVVGWAEGHRGLRERFVARADSVAAIDGDLSSVHATVVQPLCTVLYALGRLPLIEGRRAAVVGLGPIGLLFTHALKALGAAHVTGVDRIDRGDVAAAFGIDEPVWGDSAAWAAGLGDERPEIVVEAVGHQTGTLTDAVTAVAPSGTVLAFGVPDEEHYPFPFSLFFRKDATLLAGVTRQRSASLARARTYLEAHRELLAPYVTDVLPVTRAQEAYELAVRPAPGRLKVVLEG